MIQELPVQICPNSSNLKLMSLGDNLATSRQGNADLSKTWLPLNSVCHHFRFLNIAIAAFFPSFKHSAVASASKRLKRSLGPSSVNTTLAGGSSPGHALSRASVGMVQSF